MSQAVKAEARQRSTTLRLREFALDPRSLHDRPEVTAESGAASRALASERREHGRATDSGIFQKCSLKLRMQRNRQRLVPLARRESDQFLVPINRFPLHVCDVGKPCASKIAKQDRVLPIAISSRDERGDLLRRECALLA